MNATLDKLRRAKYLSTIDLTNGYWQIPLTEDSKPLTAFTVPNRGLMQFTVMPFGLNSAPAAFQRFINSINTPELEPYAFFYLDDNIIVTFSFAEHVQLTREVLRRLREAKLKPNWDKCQFGRKRLRYLGHVIDAEGLRTDPEKTAAIAALTAPTNIRELRRFVGLVSWYRRFVPNASALASPLNKLLRKKMKWVWGEDQQRAFEELKLRLTRAPVLACPDFTKPFVLQTDASNEGLGAMLTQPYDDKERVIAYPSRSLSSVERNYSATEKEFLAVIWGIWKMRDYLEGYHFTVLTDHQSLKWLEKIDNPSGRLARWAIELSQWDYDIRYHRGAENHVADALSRQPFDVCTIDTKDSGKWYRDTLAGVQANPRSFPEYCIHEGRLFHHILHTLDFNEHSESKAFLEEYKIEHQRTPPYTPQCNPVERTNKFIKTAINQYLGKSQKKWDALLLDLAFAYQSAASDSTGYTLAYLNYGRELIPPGSLYQEQGKRPDVPCQDRKRRIQEALELAGTKLAYSFQKQQKYYNLHRRDWARPIKQGC